MKIILAGPPHSGKSCLRQGLKDAIRALSSDLYPYVITACPDGEGAWFQETASQDGALAAACKERYKSKFSPEFVERVAASVRDCEQPLCFVDIGGKIDPYNERICEYATHAILVSGTEAKFDEWRAFCGHLNLLIVAEILSDYDGLSDQHALGEDGILRGSVHHMERGESLQDRPTVRALASHVLALQVTYAGRGRGL